MAIAIGSDQIISLFPGYLNLENQDIKMELMQYILKNPEGFSKSDVSLLFYLPNRLNNLSNRYSLCFVIESKK